jgi:hypothetical protein
MFAPFGIGSWPDYAVAISLLKMEGSREIENITLMTV